jgi:hypothetical protein
MSTRPARAGVIDQDVNPAEGAYCGVDRLLCGGFLARITRDDGSLGSQ